MTEAPETIRGVEVERTTVPLLGVRRSRIFVDNQLNDWYLASAVTGPVVYKPGERAHCRNLNTEHLQYDRTPSLACTCGYYVIADPQELALHCINYTVDMWVSMHGKVVEHEMGYRAEYIHCLHGSARCNYCYTSASWLLFVSVRAFRGLAAYREGMLSVEALCDKHKEKGYGNSEVRYRSISVSSTYDGPFWSPVVYQYVPLEFALAKLGIPHEGERYWEL